MRDVFGFGLLLFLSHLFSGERSNLVICTLELEGL